MIQPFQTSEEAVCYLSKSFQEGGINNASFEARLLVSEILQCSLTELLLKPLKLTARQTKLLSDWQGRRLNREPIDRILGYREFYGLNFLLSKESLSPRPDSEALVDKALYLFPHRQKKFSILDLGTGTGCLLLSILSHFPQAWGVGIDQSEDTLKTAQRNAQNLGLSHQARFARMNWNDGLKAKFDLVISNPPYIPAYDIDHLQDEVRLHDPQLALAGGKDGLDAYRFLLPQITSLLMPNGQCLMELGKGQFDAVAKIAMQNGLQVAPAIRDLSGIDRIIHVQQNICCD